MGWADDLPVTRRFQAHRLTACECGRCVRGRLWRGIRAGLGLTLLAVVAVVGLWALLVLVMTALDAPYR